MDIKKLKEKYGNKKVREIEKEIKAKNELSLEARKDAIFALRYLERTGRYKENPTYKKSDFKNYLLGQYNIREKTYRESLRAFTKFEDATIKYGVGLVSKVFRDCGMKKDKQVIEEIQKTDKALKNPIQRAKIDTIIAKHAKPKPEAKPGYKTLYFAEVRKCEAAIKRYKEAETELREAKEQIRKLQATVLELRPLRDMREAIMPFINPEIQHESRVN